MKCNKVILATVWPQFVQILKQTCTCDEVVLVLPWASRENVSNFIKLLYEGHSEPFSHQVCFEQMDELKKFLKCLDIKMDNITLSRSMDNLTLTSSKPYTVNETKEFLITPCYEDDDSNEIANVASVCSKDIHISPLNFRHEDNNNIYYSLSSSAEVKCNRYCSNKCHRQVESWCQEDRDRIKSIFRSANGYVDTRNKLIQHLHVQKNICASAESFRFNGQSFCINYFSHLTGISKYIVKTVMDDFRDGRKLYEHGNVGILKQQPKTTGFIVWMKEFAEKYGNYSPDGQKILLCYWLRKGVLYKLYTEECQEPHIAESTFYEYFDLYFGPNRIDKKLPCIRISKYSSHGVCNTCVALNNNRRQCKTEQELKIAKDLINQVMSWPRCELFTPNLIIIIYFSINWLLAKQEGQYKRLSNPL